MNPASSNSEDWILAARLLRPQGRRGELLAEPMSDLPSLFEAGRRVRLAAPPGTAADASETTLQDHWQPTGRNAGRVVLKLEGCETINDAELLAGRDLFVLASDLPPLDSDTWFVRDLIGCTLFNGETPLGEITGLQYAMAPDGRTRLEDAAPLLEVAPQHPDDSEAAPEPALIPFVKAWLDAVDINARRIVMHLPPGLVDAEPESAS